MNDNKFVMYLDSPIGLLEICGDDEYILSINFAVKRENEERNNNILLEAKEQLEEYFCGKRKKFNIPIKMSGTEFQKKVWNKLIEIPYGELATYGEIAKEIGNKNASRAVGSANNKNKIPIVIPCHRIIGSNGKLIGYDGGLWRKKWLIEHERNIIL
ncbi:methylated-DNA--[Clostridium sp. D2Q-14]|uniref:methylated-DNA--[protein]-cysteine S-methyltransferase n=1 Tax=Anaeromonas gelatinilytica TaxID=2683194 RepID=UPI00193B0E65|nr:methylated-DNA--[protein]-cysteine S-methyltransferase [Anaeromonas gelatinilytica]MBS4535743.1 methylated-DNA--[protein]-cysteine S-methyltransferase [Anaeromonas gelatinilytica]